MSQNECGCTDNCPHKTSEITTFDGTLTNITVPAGSSLNDVLLLIEQYVNNTASCNDVNYTLGAYSACLNLAEGTYSFQQILDAIVTTLCNNISDVSDIQETIIAVNTPTTTTVTLDGIIYPECFSSFNGVTNTDLLNQILADLCVLLDEQGPVVNIPNAPDTPFLITPIDANTNAPTGEDTNALVYHKNSRIEHVAEALKSILDNNSFLYEHTMPVVSPTSFSVRVNPMRGVVENFLVIRKEFEELTVNPSKDTYFYLSAGGYILRREGNIGDPPPSDAVGAHVLYKVESDGSGVVSITALYEDNPFASPPPLGVDAVDTVNILDDAVTTPKLADVITGSIQGDNSLFVLSVNDKGQVTSWDYNIDITGLSDGQILRYNGSSLVFENSDDVGVSSPGVIPKADALGENYIDSALSESTFQVTSEKRIEINSGLTEDIVESGLNIVEGTFILPRYLAVNASTLSLINGTMIYVIDTDATFTSPGVWAVESNVWVKL
jgi:hypothetical protein